MLDVWFTMTTNNEFIYGLIICKFIKARYIESKNTVSKAAEW